MVVVMFCLDQTVKKWRVTIHLLKSEPENHWSTNLQTRISIRLSMVLTLVGALLAVPLGGWAHQAARAATSKTVELKCQNLDKSMKDVELNIRTHKVHKDHLQMEAARLLHDSDVYGKDAKDLRIILQSMTDPSKRQPIEDAAVHDAQQSIKLAADARLQQADADKEGKTIDQLEAQMKSEKAEYDRSCVKK